MGGRSHVTFKQLHDETGRTLRLGVCNVGTKKFEFLDYQTAPNMPLATACRASSSIPFVFVPRVYEDRHYVDGGLQGNLPATAFPAAMNGIAFHLMSGTAFAEADEERRRDLAPPRPPSTFLEFAEVVVAMLHNNPAAQSADAIQHEQETNRRAFRSGGMKVIRINTGSHGGLETHLEQAQVDEMIRAGTDAAESYLRQERDATSV
mmetsp:Transcript_61478/g.183229  ORF Transcript_61478/g.183229 Transcript_61478/m.183229 type:complete len:206 (-) Transcript_61478:145-762(-)